MTSKDLYRYITASVPFLREHGTNLTRRFYATLFAENPELKTMFNMSNQARGEQQKVLASALFAYAANIDAPDKLTGAVERIAHRHAALGVQPADYSTVGRHLLAALREELGEGADPALLAAWDEAYWLLAGQLIATEARLYERSAQAGNRTATLTVSAVVDEGPNVRSFYLRAADGGSPGSFSPGQYVEVQVPLVPGPSQSRPYSLSDAPGRDYWRITVKAESGDPTGVVSHYLHNQVRVGQPLQVSAPYGEFLAGVLDRNAPLVLLCAGVGVTPMISLLNTLAERIDGRPILFAYATRSRKDQLFQAELAKAQQALPRLRTRIFYGDAEDENSRRMQLAAAELEDFKAGDAYLCGPDGFMKAQEHMFLQGGWSPEQLQREVFGPALLADMEGSAQADEVSRVSLEV